MCKLRCHFDVNRAKLLVYITVLLITIVLITHVPDTVTLIIIMLITYVHGSVMLMTIILISHFCDLVMFMAQSGF